MYRRLKLGILCLTLFLPPIAGCQRRPADDETLPTVARVVSTIAPHGSATPAPPAPTETLSKPTIPATIRPTATSLPTPTTAQPLLLAVPAQWELEALVAAAAVNSGPAWQVVTAENPEQLLDGQQVQAALIPGNSGYEAGSRPLALAVSFGNEWEDVTRAEAEEIQSNGHAIVEVLSWDELLPAQRPLTIDGLHITDPDYPLRQAWTVEAMAHASQSAEQLAGRLQHLANPGDVKLIAVGDVMLDRALGATVAAGDTGFPFAFVSELLHDGDFTVGNVESALGDRGEPAAKSYAFRAPPLAARSLAEAGFDLVSLANNHALDFGPQALMQGIGLLRAEGIAVVGAGANQTEAYRAHIVDINGIRFGFLGYVNVPVEGNAPFFDTALWTAGAQAPGLAWAEPDVVAANVRQLRGEVDQVVVILHSGYEYVPSPSPEQAASARAAIDAGATLVIGHHAHILQGVEFRGDGAIVYGLGNFAFNITGTPETAILNAWFDENGLRQLHFLPAIIQSSGQPLPAGAAEATGIRRQIYSLSRSLN